MRLNILTRKTLGGLQTDLSGRVLRQSPAPGGQGPRPVPGLFAAGEVAGFGGGGMHGYRSSAAPPAVTLPTNQAACSSALSAAASRPGCSMKSCHMRGHLV